MVVISVTVVPAAELVDEETEPELEIGLVEVALAEAELVAEEVKLDAGEEVPMADTDVVEEFLLELVLLAEDDELGREELNELLEVMELWTLVEEVTIEELEELLTEVVLDATELLTVGGTDGTSASRSSFFATS